MLSKRIIFYFLGTRYQWQAEELRKKLGKQGMWLILKGRVKKGFVWKYNHGRVRQRARIVLINS